MGALNNLRAAGYRGRSATWHCKAEIDLISRDEVTSTPPRENGGVTEPRIVATLRSLIDHPRSRPDGHRGRECFAAMSAKLGEGWDFQRKFSR